MQFVGNVAFILVTIIDKLLELGFEIWHCDRLWVMLWNVFKYKMVTTQTFEIVSNKYNQDKIAYGLK
jgi:hypothetical protein